MFRTGRIPNGALLLGDSGYPLQPWLMTPFPNECCPSEEIFNQKHRSTRNVIERCFGVLKARFQIIGDSSGYLHYAPDKICKIIICAAVLHNICKIFNLEEPEICNYSEDNDSDNDSELHDNSADNLSAIIIRREIACRFQAAR